MRRTILLFMVMAAALLVGGGVALAASVSEVEPNDSLAEAQNIDGSFSLDSDPNIGNETINTSEIVPHATVNGTGNETVDYYSFTVSQAGDGVILDVDGAAFCNEDQTSCGGFDSWLDLYDSSGNFLAQEQDSSPSLGQGGSVSELDTYLKYTFQTPGTYYVAVGKWDGLQPIASAIPSGASYQLQVSLGELPEENPPPPPPPPPGTSFTVTTAADEQNTNDQCSLREAMINANQNDQSGSTDCAAGVAGDTINFNLGSTATITLGSPLPVINGFHPFGLIIDGGSADITISGDNKYRVFEVDFDPATLSNLTVANGVPADGGGGGIYNHFGTLTVSNSTISDNSGLGIYNRGGTLTVSNSTISDNSSGGIYNEAGTLTVSNSTISDNSGTGTRSRGGGILNLGAGGTSGTLTVSNSTISGNSAVSGGGIFNTGTVTVSNSTISGNSAPGITGFVSGGGGILNGRTLTVSNSTLSGNSAAFGGGILNQGDTVTVSNSTLSGNSATGYPGGSGGEGGGIYNERRATREGTLMVNSSTISGNSAAFSGGIRNSGSSSATFKNTIVAVNDGRGFGPDLRGVFTSQGHNLIGKSDEAGGFTNGQNGDLVGTAANPIDPMLGPLANNGGPTITHALLEGSPAMDNGVAVEGITTDQRGVARPQGAAPDIGSFEFEAPDTTAPSVSCSVSPNRLRTSANNHKLVTVTATVQVTDPGSGPGGFTLVSVTSNQEDSGLGTDDVPNDIQGWTIDDADTSGQLRTERYGRPRTYTLTYEGTDLVGNTKSCQATVTMPKGKG